MIKFLLGVAVVAFTSFCGWLLSKKYRQRKDFFKQLKEFNSRFLSEISYTRRPLREFAQTYAYRGEFKGFLFDFFRCLERSVPLEGGFCRRERYPFLTEEEGRLLEGYFSMLGKGDSASQKGYFSSMSDKLSILQQESEKDAKRYGDLYVKIGFLCGLLVLILIV